MSDTINEPSIKFSQLPIAQTISVSAYAPIIDLNEPIGSQNQIIPLTLLGASGSSVRLDGEPVTALDPTYFTFGENGVTLQNIPTGTFSPTITVDEISDQIYGDGSNFVCTGTLAGYGFSPNLIIYLNDNFTGNTGNLPFFEGNTGTSTSSSFTVTVNGGNLTLGSNTIYVTDILGAVSNTVTVNVYYALATSAYINGELTSINLGQPFDNGTNGVSPSYAQGWATYSDGSQDLVARQSFTNGNFPTFTASAAGTYYIAIYDSETGGNLLAETGAITVINAVTSAILSNVPSNGQTGVPISGITVALTPSDSTAWAGLTFDGGADGSPVEFTGTNVPTLTPMYSGEYSINIYNNSEGVGNPITSQQFLVS